MGNNEAIIKSNVAQYKRNGIGTPPWRRYTMTIEEAATYYHIGEKKLRALVDEHLDDNFYVMNGNRVLIKREKFEHYLDQVTVV
jgi:excisionase family DNA binding protein